MTLVQKHNLYMVRVRVLKVRIREDKIKDKVERMKR